MNSNPTTKTTNDETERGTSSNDAPVLMIKAAAIISRSGEIFTLPPPNRHQDIGLLMEAQRKERPRYSDMGFLLSDGTWCDRRTAMKIALAAGQVSKQRDPELTTNDLW